MNVYQRSDRPRPDADFVPGELRLLTVGRQGRLLDARRTPVSIVRIEPATGTFFVRIEDFEDRGALWESLLENVSDFQFEPGDPDAPREDVALFERAIETFDRTENIPCNAQAAARTRARIDRARERARQWLERDARTFADPPRLPDPRTREGIPELQSDLEAYMASLDLSEMEDGFARQFVSNPYSGHRVQGHRMVIAALGLSPYHGKIARHPDIFEGSWSRERREAHVIARLAFVREAFARFGWNEVHLYRGFSTDGEARHHHERTFVSATFSLEVAMSHFESLAEARTRALLGQQVGVDRIFMTYLETRPMNHPFKEAEAALFSDPESSVF